MKAGEFYGKINKKKQGTSQPALVSHSLVCTPPI